MGAWRDRLPVVQGREAFTQPVLIDAQAITRLEAVSNLAPLHNFANLARIRVARELRPGLPQVTLFDTAFHHNRPDHARYYTLPLTLQRQRRARRDEGSLRVFSPPARPALQSRGA